MRSIVTSLKSITKIQALAIVLIIIGLGLVIYFGMRSIRSFRQLQYIEEQALFTATASPDAIRPWMTVRFVATAYAVPQEYLFAELEIPYDQRNNNDTLYHLNQEFQLGRSANGEYPAIIDRVREAIGQYQANPITTGIEGDIRAWMSVQYIANSTGIPAEYIFEQIGLPMAGNEYKPLRLLDEEFDYNGGRQALVEAVQTALDQYGGAP
jgi:hypothetical protein